MVLVKPCTETHFTSSILSRSWGACPYVPENLPCLQTVAHGAKAVPACTCAAADRFSLVRWQALSMTKLVLLKRRPRSHAKPLMPSWLLCRDGILAKCQPSYCSRHSGQYFIQATIQHSILNNNTLMPYRPFLSCAQPGNLPAVMLGTKSGSRQIAHRSASLFIPNNSNISIRVLLPSRQLLSAVT